MFIPGLEAETTGRSAARPRADVRHTRGRFHYLVRGNEKPQVFVDSPEPGTVSRTAEYAGHSMPVQDGRSAATELDLDGSGFVIRHHPTRLADFDDDDETRRVLYPEIEALLLQETQAGRVIIFDHTVRTSGGHAGSGRRAVPVVHNDYTERSGVKRAAEVLAREAPGSALPARHAIVNAWRPIGMPVERDPLALLDARTVDPAQLSAVDIHFPGRSGEIYEVAYDTAHRWTWFPRMEPGEVLLFKQYDSLRDGVARFTPHSAFADPGADAGAPTRHSIELRALVLFGLDGSSG